MSTRFNFAISSLTNTNYVPFNEYLNFMDGYLQAQAQETLQRIASTKAKIDQFEEAYDSPFNDGINVLELVRAGRFAELPSEAKDLADEFLFLQEFELWMMGAFTVTLYYSFFINLYSFLESQLNDECKARKQNDETVRLSLNDMNGKGIFKAKTYLTKVLEIEEPFKLPEWSEINKYNLLRNCLVHHEGILKEFQNKKELQEYIKREPTLTLDPSTEKVILTKEFCEEAARVISHFLQAVEEG